MIFVIQNKDLDNYVNDGWVGKNSGIGFYKYWVNKFKKILKTMMKKSTECNISIVFKFLRT